MNEFKAQGYGRLPRAQGRQVVREQPRHQPRRRGCVDTREGC